MSKVASPCRASKQHIIARFALGGVLFGLCFPLTAWTIDIFLHHLAHHWSSLVQLHHTNPIHYLVDSAPLILGLTFTAIGVKQSALEQDRTALERMVAALSDANACLESLATTDALTSLKNHRALQEKLDEEYNRSKRYGHPLSLLMIDVDKFKAYNDTFGHPVGDSLLKELAEVLKTGARTSDYVARYGGEEFMLVLPEAGKEEAREVGERIRRAIENHDWIHRHITVSVGIGTVEQETNTAQMLIDLTDKALYYSKRQGRNRVTHASELPAAVLNLSIDSTMLRNELLQHLQVLPGNPFAPGTLPDESILIQAYESNITSWSRLLDLKDKETEGHSERVTQMMVRLACHLKMNEQEVLFARWGARLHDIGKMAIPDHILNKQGPLTEDEWVIMRQHTSIAHEMLESIEFLGSAIEIPYCHHEKWDGSGYPRGLKGEEIPLMARLFAVIDVYDALTSDRPYRKAWSEEKVRAHLREQAGTHFDPRALKRV